MEEGAEIDVLESCKECGMKKAIVKSGFLYCVECGMRSAGSQPVIDFTYEDFSGAALKTTKVRTGKKKKLENELSNMWSTWHAHNMILLGLVDETVMCGAKSDTLPGAVLRLWSKWLQYNKVAFFSKKDCSVPQLTLGFKPRDLNLLYGIKKKKKRPPTAVSQDETNTQLSQKSKALKILNEYVKQEHKELMETQTSAVPLASQNLEDIKYKADVELKEITFNPKTKKYFKSKMSEEDYELHRKEGYCSTNCKCFKHHRSVFKQKHKRTSIFNLYVLLYLGLRINDEEAQLGDILRWCREGHVTFGDYKHFFLDDMTINPTDRLTLSPSIMTHKNILYTASQLAKSFIPSGIKGPNILQLIKRYIEELELPHELLGLITKIIKVMSIPPDFYPDEDTLLPNYEAIALSYIIIILKMLFGFDGVSEHKISSTAETCNEILKLVKHRKELIKIGEPEDHKLGFRRLFVLDDWMRYIEYRKVCLSQCHYPTKMRYDSNCEDNPELFLFHRNKIRRKQPDGIVKNNCQSIIKSLLQRIEDNYEHEIENQYPLFSPSLTPMASNVSDLLSWQYLNSEYSNVDVNIDILNEEFSFYNVSFLIHPRPLKDALSKNAHLLYTHVYNGNMDMIVDPTIEKKAHSGIGVKLKEIITVVSCTDYDWEGVLLAEKTMDVHEASCSKLNDSIISLKSTTKSNTPNKSKHKKQQSNKTPIDLFLCFEHYWIRHYSNIKMKFSEKSFEQELEQNFPSSFSWLLKECASMAEMTTLSLYKELTKIEKQIMQINCDKRKKKVI